MRAYLLFNAENINDKTNVYLHYYNNIIVNYMQSFISCYYEQPLQAKMSCFLFWFWINELLLLYFSIFPLTVFYL